MTPQAIVAALAVVALIAVVAYLVARLRDADRAFATALLRQAETENQAQRASAEATTANADVIAQRRQLADARGRQDHAVERIAELEEDLAAYRCGLVGQFVLINTALPDDRSIRGIVAQELDDGGLVLRAADLLETVPGRGGATVSAQPLGDVVVPSYSFLQKLTLPLDEEE